MTLEQQVTNLELSKRLKELEVKQNSLFYWQQGYKEMKGTESASYFEITQVKIESKKGMRCFSAYTVAELGEMLAQIIKIKKVRYQLFVSVAMDKQWFVVYANEEDYSDNAPFPFMMKHNEADARAEMLIYLLENKLITNNHK